MYTQTLFVAPTLRVSSPLSPLVPSISVSPAADTVTYDAPEPTSPEAQSPRSTHLLPPPVSPLRRALAPAKAADKKGLDQSTFEDLLVANRERAARRSVNAADRLRREVVVKAHHSKQIERRALFLSKIAAPPSPTSTETAVTPPESPAVFHFTLPSPGLASPLELFERVEARDSWVEHVDYNKPVPRLPSLDQITARLRSPVPERVEVKPRASRLPESFRASARVRSVSPPTPTAVSVPTPTVTVTAPAPTVTVTAPAPVVKVTAPAPAVSAPSQLIIPSSPPKSIRPVLVPQSIPALRLNHTPAGPELAPVPVMSWRDRAAPTPRKDSLLTPRKDTFPVASWKEHTLPRKEPLIQAGSWRDGQGQITSWREVPVRKEVVRASVPISPRTVSTPVGAKPASVPAPARAVNVESRRSALARVQRDAAGAVKMTESERRAVQGRNMLDKLRRRISAPAEMEGSMRRGVPVGGF